MLLPLILPVASALLIPPVALIMSFILEFTTGYTFAEDCTAQRRGPLASNLVRDHRSLLLRNRHPFVSEIEKKAVDSVTMVDLGSQIRVG